MVELLEEQLDPLLVEEFAGNMDNLRKTQEGYGMRLVLLIEQKNRQECEEQHLHLLGFLAYKVWSHPRPSVSICAMAVPMCKRGYGYGRRLLEVAMEVAASQSTGGSGLLTLLSLPEAVGFYSRIGFQRSDGESFIASDYDAEDAPCLPMSLRCSCPVSPSATSVQGVSVDAVEEPWSFSLCKALEDGPTWPAVQTVIAACGV